MIIILGATAFTRMPVDVFPDIKIPAVVVATFYQGMPPLDMEDNITFRYERFFTLGSNIEHIESRSLSGVSIIKVFFQPGTDIEAAAAQMGTLAMADLGIMPPGTLPPLVLQYDASSLPVVLVTLEGKGYDETQLEDQARYNIRNQLATVPGASAPIPFGGKFRQVMAYANAQALQARGLSLMDVVHALDKSNLILPAGDVKIGSKDYYIYSNSMIEKVPDIGQVPVKIGRGQAPVLMNDVAKVEDSAQIQYNKVLINGQPSVYIPVLRQVGANTISVVDGVKRLLPKVFGLPPGMKLKTIFDQSIYVRQAVESLEHEAISGSVLASLVILIFLGSFRSTFAIFLSIPLSILAGGFGLFISSSTINIMTLGGFALAIGRLVDDSVVVLENINRHLAEGKEPFAAAREGAEEVALPVLASTITTCIVFFPVMFLFGVAKYLFSALALAVVLSMAASYLVAMSIIPLYCARFLNQEQALAAEHGGSSGVFAAFNNAYERFASGYERLLEKALNHKAVVVGGVAILFVVSLAMYPRLGTELFPATDAGTFTINFRAPAGTRIELTTDMARQIEAIVRNVIPPSDLDMVVSNIGIAPSISAIYSPNAAQDSGFIQVALKSGHSHATKYYVSKLRQILPQQLPNARTLFSSGSIIDSVLNLGPDVVDRDARAPVDNDSRRRRHLRFRRRGYDAQPGQPAPIHGHERPLGHRTRPAGIRRDADHHQQVDLEHAVDGQHLGRVADDHPAWRRLRRLGPARPVPGQRDRRRRRSIPPASSPTKFPSAAGTRRRNDRRLRDQPARRLSSTSSRLSSALSRAQIGTVRVGGNATNFTTLVYDTTGSDGAGSTTTRSAARRTTSWSSPPTECRTRPSVRGWTRPTSSPTSSIRSRPTAVRSIPTSSSIARSARSGSAAMSSTAAS